MTGRKFILMTLLAALLAAGFCLSAAAEEAENLTEKCTVKMSSHSERAKRITDGDYRTYWESAETENPWVTITSPDPVYGLYLCFQKKPESYEIQRASGDDWVTVTAGDVRFHHVFYEMDGVKKIRIRATGGEKTVMGFNEIFVFGAGDFPDWVQRWEEPEGKADILFVATHPDDDALFLGSAIIYYNTELKKNVRVAFLTWSNTTRRSEALNGLWTMGVRTYPDFGGFRDTFTNPTRDMKKAYQAVGGKDLVLEWITGMFRRYRPDVVVTQDMNGEYGHPQHRMLVRACTECWDLAADPEKYPESAAAYGAWEVKKLYLHLYGDEADQTDFDWEVPLQSMGGKTANEVAEEAYAMHVTQRGQGKKFGGKFYPFSVEEYGIKRYPNNRFGLYASRVGADTEHNDFMENLNGADE